MRTAQGEHAAALAAARAACPRVSGRAPRPLPRRRLAAGAEAERRGVHAVQGPAGRRPRPRDPEQSRRHPAAPRRRPPTRASRCTYFTKAAEAEPDDPDILFNLGYAYALDRDPQGAIYWLREALRRDPDRRRRAHRPRRRARRRRQHRRSGARAGARRAAVAAVTRSRGRRRDCRAASRASSRHLDSCAGNGIDQAITNTAQRDQRELAQFHLERGRRLYRGRAGSRGDERAAPRGLPVALRGRGAPAASAASTCAAGGRREAVDALKISIWSRDTAAAHVALADAYLRLKDLPEREAARQKALALDPASAEARRRCWRESNAAGSWRGTDAARWGAMTRRTLLTALIGAAMALTLRAAVDRAPIVETATVDGIIHPVSSEFMRSAIAQAPTRGRRADRLHAAHARRPARLHARHQQRHHRRQDAGRRVRRPGRLPRRVGRLPDHHRRRRRRHGARHPHRRRASRRRATAKRSTR